MAFDPSIYENVKVVLEGSVYDLDLAGAIHVQKREDLVDLASFTRTFRMELQTALEDRASRVTATLSLSSGISDFAGEWLEGTASGVPGCSLDIAFVYDFEGEQVEAEELCRVQLAVLEGVWGERIQVSQTISYKYGGLARLYRIRTTMNFGRRFGEEVLEDLPGLTDHVVLTLQELEKGLAP